MASKRKKATQTETNVMAPKKKKTRLQQNEDKNSRKDIKHALVVYLEDGIYHTTELRCGKLGFPEPGSKLKVKWINGSRYEAEVLLVGSKEDILSAYKKTDTAFFPPLMAKETDHTIDPTCQEHEIGTEYGQASQSTTLMDCNYAINPKQSVSSDVLFDQLWLENQRNYIQRSLQKTRKNRIEDVDVEECCEDYVPESCTDDSDIDPDYVCSDVDSNYSEEYRPTTKVCKIVEVAETEDITHVALNSVCKTNDLTDCSNSSHSGSSSQNNENVKVGNKSAGATVVVLGTANLTNRRCWDKKQACMCCQSMQYKLPRHWERKHKSELQVQKLMSLTKNSKERKAMIEDLRNKGNFAHNNAVLSANSGNIIAIRRPARAGKKDDYYPCSTCFGWFHKKQLWRHKRRCNMKHDTRNQEGGRLQRHVLSYSNMMQSVPYSATEGLRENVLRKMKDDSITLAVRNDELILKFGSKLYSKLGYNEHQWVFISQKMRELGRLLIGVREEVEEVRSLTDCINVIHFNGIIRSVKRICGYNETSHKYAIPSLALKLGHSIKKCALICKTEALKCVDEKGQKMAEQLSQLCETEWTAEISTHAVSNLEQNKWNNHHLLPVADDLRKLNGHAQTLFALSLENIKQNASKESFDQLCQVTLLLVILFNRKRSGESSRMLITSFTEHKSNNNSDSEILETLTPFERKLADCLTLITIRGKRGRGVPVLLTPLMKEGVEILVDGKTRRLARVHEKNPYIFPRVNFDSLQCQRGTDVLRKFANDCGASQPQLLTSTKLRKHIATMSQVVNLKGTELDCLASFMGHDVRVHHEFYRLPQSTLYLAKVSKLLLAIEKGNADAYKGKTLDEIEMDEHTTLTDEEYNEGEQSDDEKEENATPFEVKDSLSFEMEGHLRNDGGLHIDEPKKQEQTNKKSCKVKKREKVQIKHNTRTPWTKKEKEALQKGMNKFIAMRKVPGKNDCEECIRNNIILENRSWQHIKFQVHNLIQTKKRQISK